MTELSVSVIIPTKDGEETIKSCIQAIWNQSVKPLEVIVIDSGSKDSTVEISKSLGAKVHSISPEEFAHGPTRNKGVQLAQAELVLMTVQDATLADSCALEKMIEHFKNDRVAGVCGQQIVLDHPKKNPLEWYRPFSEPRIRRFEYSEEALDAMSPEDKRYVCAWDDVIAMYRKVDLLEVPFENVIFQEDAFWAYQTLKNGKCIVFDDRVKVDHYHHVDFKEHYKRKRIEYLADFFMFQKVPQKHNMFKEILLCSFRIIKNGYAAHWINYNVSMLRAEQKAARDFLKNDAHKAHSELYKELYN